MISFLKNDKKIVFLGNVYFEPYVVQVNWRVSIKCIKSVFGAVSIDHLNKKCVRSSILMRLQRLHTSLQFTI